MSYGVGTRVGVGVGVAAMATLSSAQSGAASVTYATWNPADKGANITLSNGNLTAANAGSRASVRATIPKTTGKWYWEITVGSLSTDYVVGIASASAAVADGNYLGQDNFAYGWFAFGSGIFKNNVQVNAAAGYTTGNVLGFALDCGAGTLALYNNNTLITTLTGIALGTIYPACGGALSSTSSATANFGATALTFTPPSGYNAGVYQ